MSIHLEKRQFASVQALRGIAALSVCWFHLAYGNRTSWLSGTASYGWLGVEMFFVISGFVVAYSLYRSEYRITSFFKFLVKRILRVDPPYVLSIAFCITLAFLSSRSALYKGEPPHFTVSQVLLHVGYLIPFSNSFQWINIVYWTLAIEFQFYIAIGLAFPLFVSNNSAKRLVTSAALCLFGVLIPDAHFFPHFVPLFLLGISGMQRLANLSSRTEFILTQVLLVGVAAVCIGKLEAVVGITTLICILALSNPPKALLFLGEISYSMYLIHVPIADRWMNLASRFVDGRFSPLLPLTALGATVIASYVMYLVIELPAKGWAASIRYGEKATHKTLGIRAANDSDQHFSLHTAFFEP